MPCIGNACCWPADSYLQWPRIIAKCPGKNFNAHHHLRCDGNVCHCNIVSITTLLRMHMDDSCDTEIYHDRRRKDMENFGNMNELNV